MKADTQAPRAGAVVDDYAARGRHYFTTADMRAALGVSAVATRAALSRLAKKGLIASPARGFYVIVPPEYRRYGCLPADHFVPALMAHSGQPYYAALLSAAEYHGAAHHRPQVFQVALAQSRRGISCGHVRVSFIARKRLAEVAVRSFNTPRGTVLVSTPEATAVDLVGYARRSGGLDNVATVLAELAEEIEPELLAEAGRCAPIPWLQRLGYLLEFVGAHDRAAPLKALVRRRARDIVPLLPGWPGDHHHAPCANDWRLRVNTEVEPDV